MYKEYDDPRDAEDAMKELDGYELLGDRIVVEFTKPRDRDRDRGDRGDRRGGRDGDRRGGRFSPPRNTDFRAVVRGIPSRVSWQDLKDFFRDVASPTFADIKRDRDGNSYGVVEFRTREDLDYAIRKKDGERLNGERIEVVAESGSGGGGGGGSRRSRSRSRSPRRSRSPSRSPRRDDDRDSRKSPPRGSSRSPSPKRARSASRSPSPRRDDAQ